METEKISHPKIAFRALLSVLIMATIILLINSWSNIKLSFNGNTPPLSDWVAYISKTSTIVSLLAFGAFFYYRDWMRRKEAIKNEKELATKHQNWIDNK